MQKRQAQTKPAFPIQSDPGANANLSITTDRLENIQYIKPVYATSAKKGSTMMLAAIGLLPITVGGETLRIKTYVSPDADGNLISPPNAIHKQYADQFTGWVMIANHDKTSGRIQMCSRNGHQDFNMNITLHSNLWWHPLHDPDEESSQTSTPASNNIWLSSLSTAALYKLWHQRTLHHSGSKVLQSLHKHANGVLQLRETAFTYAHPVWPQNVLLDAKM